MQLLIYGPGRLGGADRGRGRRGRLAGAGAGRPTRPPTAAGRRRPRGRRRRRLAPRRRSSANVEHALRGGQPGVRARHDRAGTPTSAGSAAASSSTVPPPSSAPNLSLGAALFLRLAETRGRLVRPRRLVRAVDRRVAPAGQGRPPVRHRPGPRPPDRRRRSRAGPTERRRPTVARSLEVAGIRAGAAPGTHLVTFDGAGESIELRLAARDRSAYADGALAAARWLVARAPRARPPSVRRRRGRPPRRRRPAPARLTASDPPRPNEGDAR